MQTRPPLKYDALVIGGGIAGLQAALNLADQSFTVAILEKDATIGGNTIRLSKVFPTLDWASCITTPKMLAAAHHEKIAIFTDCDLMSLVRQTNGDLTASITRRPRYVDQDKCVGCRRCEQGCPAYVPDEEQGGLTLRKAIRIPFSNAIPQVATLDVKNCSLCGKCAEACASGAILYDQEPETFVIQAATAVVATGFSPAPTRRKTKYSRCRVRNVITAMQMEHLLAPHGPYQRVIRPSDGKEPASIAYVQHAGSGVCCMYVLKQAMLISSALPSADITIYARDIHASSKGCERFCQNAKAMGIKFKNAGIAKIAQAAGQNVSLCWDALEEGGRVAVREHDLVVLSQRMVPQWDPTGICALATTDDHFIQCRKPQTQATVTVMEGVFVAGAAAGPKDIIHTIAEAGKAAMEASSYLKSAAHRNAA